MGGTDDSENIEELTIKEHSIAHKILYEKYENWQDKVAWLGLSKMINKEKILEILHKKTAKKSNKIMASMKIDPRKGKAGNKIGKGAFIKGNQITAKEYLLRSPEGEMVKIKGLSKWCRENGFNNKSFHKQVIERKGKHKGWSKGTKN